MAAGVFPVSSVSPCRPLRGLAPGHSMDQRARVRLGAKSGGIVESLETERLDSQVLSLPHAICGLPSLLSALLVSSSSLQRRPEVYCPDELNGDMSGSGRRGKALKSDLC